MNDRIAQLKKLLETDPDDAFCLYGLAFEYEKIGEHQAAVEHFDLSLEVDPDFCYAYYHKARAQKALGDTPGAISTLQAGLERAKATGDEKAVSEISTLLHAIS